MLNRRDIPQVVLAGFIGEFCESTVRLITGDDGVKYRWVADTAFMSGIETGDEFGRAWQSSESWTALPRIVVDRPSIIALSRG